MTTQATKPKVLNDTTKRFYQWEFSAEDLDAKTMLTDVVYLATDDPQKAEILLVQHVKEKHPITTLSGNTWELQEFSLTGKEVDKQTIVTLIQPADSEKEYPVMNEL